MKINANYGNYHHQQYTVHNGYSDNFAALGVSPSKSHTNFIGYSDIIIGYSDNSYTNYTRILDFDHLWPHNFIFYIINIVTS